MNQKVWGTSETLFQDSLTWITEIHVVQGGFSSRHHHETLYNGFVVVSGALLLVEYDGTSERNIVLVPQTHGHKFAPGHQHRFEALEETVAREIYWPKVGCTIDVADIVRQDTGGVKQ